MYEVSSPLANGRFRNIRIERILRLVFDKYVLIGEGVLDETV